MADIEKTGLPGEVVETTASPNAAASPHDNDHRHDHPQVGGASRPESINVSRKQTLQLIALAPAPLVTISHSHCTRNCYSWKKNM
jgi:hypothetical protein